MFKQSVFSNSWLLRICLLLALVAGLSTSLTAGTISIEKPFELDRWIELSVEDGPATLHRLRIQKVRGGLTKSKIFRPGNDHYLETVQIQIEYSNGSSRDWEVTIDIRWVDERGQTIDGYQGTEDLDEDEREELATVTLSTLSYGLDKADRLLIDLEFDRD